MFSAVILVCVNGLKLPDQCETYVSTYMLETKSECIADIDNVIKYGYFDFYIDEENYVTVVDSRCINWNEISTAM